MRGPNRVAPRSVPDAGRARLTPGPTRRIALGFVAAAAALVAAIGVPARATAAAEPERLVLRPASPATTFEVEARFPTDPRVCEAKRRKPLRAVYRGSLEVVRETDGSLSVVNELPFDDYLEGLAEMPRSWPMEALRAQVIAARSYALYGLVHRPPSLARRGVDICATDQCQVYRGAAVALGAFGERWVRAVASTRGLALLYRGDPAQTFYFSTSTGRTRTNTDVFGGPPRAYLPSVRAFDSDAPLARWRVTVGLRDLAAVLREARLWTGGAITRAAERDGAIELQGAGRRARLSKRQVRTALNNEAACLFPARYPTRSPSGARLPLTVPSRTYALAQEGASVVFDGRGWGHGVGMSQYGARALADRGWTAARVLAHFYGGLAPRRVAEPDRIRVLAAEDALVVRVAVNGRVRASTATGSALTLGDAFEVRGGRALRIRRGVGPGGTPVLTVGLNTHRLAGAPGDTIGVRFVLNRPARASIVIERAGAEVARAPERSFENGAAGLSLPLAGDAGPFAPGDYAVVVEAFDGIDRVRSEAIPLAVAAPVAFPTPAVPPGRGGIPGWAIAAGAAGGLAVALALGRRLIRR